ncbi:hypothetical protein [Paenibacillus amylolyticus]|uniref:hypothetical protein n=1 Tax=Paenibacillus amylolyticus TaxID=1451 RepID=UPI00201DA20F|nr:hypothetical protein [Paenibacillus amylolyticus]MCL6664550.1 hypothetical protein [Paenibacillus amylolyticus]
MTLKNLQEVERDLTRQKIELLESMNNFLYVHRDAYDSNEYKEMSKDYSRLTRELETVQIQISNVQPKIGRPQIGVGKPVKITLPEDDWKRIEDIINHGHALSFADYFRQLHQNQ